MRWHQQKKVNQSIKTSPECLWMSILQLHTRFTLTLQTGQPWRKEHGGLKKKSNLKKAVNQENDFPSKQSFNGSEENRERVFNLCLFSEAGIKIWRMDDDGPLMNDALYPFFYWCPKMLVTAYHVAMTEAQLKQRGWSDRLMMTILVRLEIMTEWWWQKRGPAASKRRMADRQHLLMRPSLVSFKFYCWEDFGMKKYIHL